MENRVLKNLDEQDVIEKCKNILNNRTSLFS